MSLASSLELNILGRDIRPLSAFTAAGMDFVHLAMSNTVFSVDAILFDMDGTLVDSTAGVVGAWETFQESYPEIDVGKILKSSHGVRTVDNLREHCRIEDPNLLEKEARRFEQTIVTSSKKSGCGGIKMLPGVKEVINQLLHAPAPSSPIWAICTSATREYAKAALKSAGLPQPDVFVVAEDVKRGKPHPDPYLLAAGKCGVDPARSIVFEDAPSGVRSGRAAGCKTVGLLTTHTHKQMEEAKPDILVKDLSNISIKAKDSGGLEITVIV